MLHQFDGQLVEIEKSLDELSLMINGPEFYGWQEDMSEKFDEWKDKVKSTFSKLRGVFANFFNRLTTREGERLPQWVYQSTGGALDSMVEYLEKRVNGENDTVRAIIIDMIRESIKTFRDRIGESSKKSDDKSGDKKVIGTIEDKLPSKEEL